MLKKIIVVSLVGCLGLLCAACSDDVEDACEHAKDKCGADPQLGPTYKALDCSKLKDEYDKLTDAQKETADKNVECVMDADNCDAIKKCGGSGG